MKMTYESNNIGVLESSQVVTPTVISQAPIMYTFGSVSVSPGEKPEKFN